MQKGTLSESQFEILKEVLLVFSPVHFRLMTAHLLSQPPYLDRSLNDEQMQEDIDYLISLLQRSSSVFIQDKKKLKEILEKY